MTKTIAITGATGFAGRHAVGALLARGYRLKALVRRPVSAGLPDGVTLIEGGLNSEAALRDLMQGVDAVVHLAGAISGLSRGHYFEVNGRGTVAVVAAAERAGVKRLVHVSSLTAREPLVSDYGASKQAGELAVASGRLSTLILRPPAIYGPGDKATLPLLRELTRAVAFIPSQRPARVSLIHAEDLARILSEAVTGRASGIIEVSDGKVGGYDWSELIAVAEAHEGRRIRPVFLPRPIPSLAGFVAGGLSRLMGKTFMINSGKIAELYHPDWVARGAGWPLASPIGFAAGFAQTLQWYRAEGWLPKARGGDRSSATANRETHP